MWNPLENIDALEPIARASQHKPQLLFKHSTTCGISGHALHNVDAQHEALAAQIDLHLLDLLTYRNISNEITHRFAVAHQSPQAILLVDGEVVYHASHSAIDPAKILAALAAVS